MSSGVATCHVSFDKWSFNDLGQSPCTVAHALLRVCVPDYRLPPLEQGYSYRGPNPGAANPCMCNTVYYNMLSACAECQGQNWNNWTKHSENCEQVDLQTFPKPVPNTTLIPDWAYKLDVVNSTTFDLFAARKLAGKDLPVAPTPKDETPPRPGKTSSEMAQIALGPAIGGAALVALAVGLFIYFRKRRRQRKIPPSQLYLEEVGERVLTPLAPAHIQPASPTSPTSDTSFTSQTRLLKSPSIRTAIGSTREDRLLTTPEMIEVPRAL